MKWQYSIRLILVSFLVLFGILLQVEKGLYAAWYLFAAAFLLLAGHALFGTVFPAFQLLQRGLVEDADKLLNQVWNPSWLLPRHRTYFFLSKGMIALKRDNPAVAEPLLRQALQLKPERPLDRAYLSLNLAHIQFLKREYQACREFLDLAKSEQVNDLVVKEHIQRLEQALANLT
ncbi:MAG: hypothetical protein H6563_14335 [Lewinellaceae bacterium]|nr:hypothetical protein [Lewinellaceae bacterium]